MDDDVDPRIGNVEEEMRLDHLETLVHHGGGIHRNLRSHLPARMGQRFGDGDALHGLQRAAQERTTGAGKDQSADGWLFLAPEALPDGTVLAVDREDLRPVATHPFT